MKTIGLLGGTAWVSTIEYYRLLNRMVNERLGKQHSARIILNSIDYEEIKQYNYQNWEKIGDILMDEIIRLDSFNVDCILVCNNTLHKALDNILPGLHSSTPILHIADCAGEFAQAQGLKKIFLVGTKFTMEDGFYHDHLKKFNLNIITPNEDDRSEIQRISQDELAKEIISEESKTWFRDLISRYPADAVLVGCTELPLIIKQTDYNIPILDTMELQCRKAVDFILG